jgi:hypothetical protein
VARTVPELLLELLELLLLELLLELLLLELAPLELEELLALELLALELLLPVAVHTPLVQKPVVQSAPEAHSAQLPAPSQTLPPLEVQGVSAARGAWLGAPLLHAPVVQSLVAAGTSVLSINVRSPPEPSQTTLRQSPTLCMETGVSIAAKVVLHMPAVQAGCWQSVVAPGHWLAIVHAPPLVLLDDAEVVDEELDEDVVEPVLLAPPPAPLPLELALAPPVPLDEPELLVLLVLDALPLVELELPPVEVLFVPPGPELPELDEEKLVAPPTPRFRLVPWAQLTPPTMTNARPRKRCERMDAPSTRLRDLAHGRQ